MGAYDDNPEMLLLVIDILKKERDAARERSEKAEAQVRLLRTIIENAIQGFDALAFTPEPTETEEDKVPWFHGNNPDCL